MEIRELLEAVEEAGRQLTKAAEGIRDLLSDVDFVKDRRSRIAGLEEVFRQKDVELGRLMAQHAKASAQAMEAEARLAKAREGMDALRKSLGA